MTTVEDKPTKVEEAEDFEWLAASSGSKLYKNQPYMKVSGCNRVLMDAATDFDITIWGLARLLGLPWLNNIYHWTNGTQRPSQMYSMRLTKLYQLERQGLKLYTVHHIDWFGDGKIHFKEVVNVSGTGGVSPKRRKVSAQESENRDEMAKFLSQSPR